VGDALSQIFGKLQIRSIDLYSRDALQSWFYVWMMEVLQVEK
jgi:hypothetical protein